MLNPDSERGAHWNSARGRCIKDAVGVFIAASERGEHENSVQRKEHQRSSGRMLKPDFGTRRTRELSQRHRSITRSSGRAVNPDSERGEHENSARERSIKDPVDVLNPDSERGEHENSARERSIKDPVGVFIAGLRTRRTRELKGQKERSIKDPVDVLNPDSERGEHENSARERSIKDPVGVLNPDSERGEHENSASVIFTLVHLCHVLLCHLCI